MALLNPRDRTPVLVVGLGNPGPEYARHRHNVGFMAVDRLARRCGLSFEARQKNALVASGRVRGRPVVLAKPQTWMNLSGEAVGPLLKLHGIEPADLLVLFDELDLALGTIRIRAAGGDGGHNGMKSILERVGRGFARLRIGVGRPPAEVDPAAHVLREFAAQELPVVEKLLETAADAVETALHRGLHLAMTRFNGSVCEEEPPQEEETPQNKRQQEKSNWDGEPGQEGADEGEAGDRREPESRSPG